MEVRLALTDAYSIEEHCLACGKTFALEAVAAVVVRPDELEDVAVGRYICRECLGAGPEGVRKRMRDQAAGLRAMAEDLEYLATEPLDLPTVRDLDRQLAFNAARGGAEACDGQ